MKKIKILAALFLMIGISATALSQARVQVIHNSADAAANMVDVWINDQMLIDNFTFRTASQFIDAPSGVDFDISILPPSSSDTTGAIARFTYNLMEGETYVLVANGIVSQTGYDPIQPFNIHVYNMGREMATSPDNADVLVMHGSTDAPVVDIKEVAQGAGTIVDDISYGEFAGYLELPVADYSLQVRNSAGTDVVAQFAAPLETLGLDGEAMVVVASGFLNPNNNSNGPSFGLFVALPAGGELVELPAEDISTARAQVIHNSADLAAATVDVWFNDQILIDDFSFRWATPFIDVPAGTDFDISILPPTSTDTTGAIAKYTYNLDGNGKYMLIANGIVSGSGYDPVKPFNIYVYDMAREIATDEMNTDVLVFHGSTDAPVVDIVETGLGAGTIVDNLAYGDYAGYLELATDDYELTITGETGENAVAVFNAPLNSLGLSGQAIAVLASGFLVPQNNSDGPGFGLYAALATGGELVALQSTTATNDQTTGSTDFKVFPNPAADLINITTNSDKQERIELSLLDITGKEIYRTIFISGNNTTSINTSAFPEGIYLARMTGTDETNTVKIKIIR